MAGERLTGLLENMIQFTSREVVKLVETEEQKRVRLFKEHSSEFLEMKNVAARCKSPELNKCIGELEHATSYDALLYATEQLRSESLAGRIALRVGLFFGSYVSDYAYFYRLALDMKDKIYDDIKIKSYGHTRD